MKVIPRSRYEFVLALYKEQLRIQKTDPENANRMNVRWTGTLPYALMDVYGHLVAGIRDYRKAQKAGQDTSFIEQTLAFNVAWMGHYVGDGGQPMHDSMYSDGWRGPNPNGYGDGRVHSRFESKFVELIGLKEADIADRVGKPGHLDGDVFDQALHYLSMSGGKVEQVFKLESGALFPT
jgi:hypothetical protein